MCAAFSAGASLTPSPGHRNHFAVALERLDDAQLLLRRDPCKHGGLTNASGKIFDGERGHFCARQHVAVGNAGFVSDRPSGLRIVSRDHHDSNARGPAFANGLWERSDASGSVSATSPTKVSANDAGS